MLRRIYKNTQILILLVIVACCANQSHAAENDANFVYTNDHLAEAERLFGLGEYSELVEYTQQVIAKDPQELELLGVEVMAGVLSDEPYMYIEACRNDAGTDLVSRLRSIILKYGLGEFRESWAAIQKLEKEFPGSCWVTFWMAKAAENLGKDSLALHYYGQAGLDSSCHWRALRNEIALRRGLGQHEECDSMITHLAEHREFATSATHKKAWLLGFRGNWTEAVRLLEKEVEKSNDAFTYEHLSSMYNLLGRHDQALKLLKRAHSLFPKNKLIASSLSSAYSSVGLEDSALAVVENFKPIHLAFTRCSLAQVIAFTLGDTLAITETSLPLIEQFCEDTAPVVRYVNWLDSRQRSVEADSIVDVLSKSCSPLAEAEIRASRQKKGNPQAKLNVFDSLSSHCKRYDRGRISRLFPLFDNARIQEAYELAEDYLRVHPGDTRLMQTMVGLEYAANNRKKALEWLDKIDSLTPGCFTAKEYRALIFLDEARTDEAEIILDSLSFQYPHNAYDLFLYVGLYGHGHKDKLKKVIDRYRQAGIHSVRMTSELVAALSVVGEYDTADSILAGAIALYPNSSQYYYSRGWINNEAGMYQAAQTYFQRARELDPYDQRFSSAATGANFETVTLDSATARGHSDTTSLVRLSVDSILALSKNHSMEPGEYGGASLLDKTQYIYFDKYSSLVRIHQIVELSTLMATMTYGELSIPFNAYLSKPLLLEARTIQPDGKTISLRTDEVVITSPPVVPESPDMSDSRVLKFSFPAADSGNILEYIIQFEGAYAEPDYFYVDRIVSDFDPGLLCEIELIVPAPWPILYEHSSNILFDTKDTGAVKVYRWRMENIEPIHWEASGPSPWEITDWVRVGYARSWKEAADAHWSQVSSKIEKTGPVKDLARRVAGKALAKEEKINALFRYVADSIRYVAIEYGAGSIIPRSATDVLVNKYGDCKDKVVLLISLLDVVGIKAYPMLVSAAEAGPLPEGIPSLNPFDHVIAYLPGEPARFLDPTCSACEKYDLFVEYKGRRGLVLGTDMDLPLVATPPPTADDNVFGRRVRMSPQPSGGAAVDVDIIYSGLTGMILKENLWSCGSVEIGQFVEAQSRTGIWAEASMIRYNVFGLDAPGKSVGWAAQLTVDSVFKTGYSVERVPISFNSLDMLLDTPDSAGRRYDICFTSPMRVKDEFVIVPGEEWKLNSQCTPWSVDTSWFAASSKFSDWGDSLSIKVEFELKQTRIPVEEMAGFIQAIEDVKTRVERQSPVFTRCLDAQRLQALTAALENNPEDISLLVLLADLYLGKDHGGEGCLGRENRSRARDLYSRALEIDPVNETMVMRMVAVQSMDGLSADADSLLNEYESTVGRTLPMILNLMKVALCVELCHYDEGLKRLETAMTQAPSDALRILMVKFYSETGRLDEAREQIELMKTLKADPAILETAKFHYCLGSGDTEGAEAIIRGWRGTNLQKITGMKMELYSVTDNWNKAIREFEKLLRNNPDNPFVLNGYAWFLALADSSFGEALDAVNRSIELVGGCNAMYINTRGFVYLKMGNLELAREDFIASLTDQSVRLSTVNNYLLGECCLEENDTEGAREYFNSALKLDGEEWSVRRAKERLAELN